MTNVSLLGRHSVLDESKWQLGQRDSFDTLAGVWQGDKGFL
jgi:hypothetical protein